MTKQQNKQHAKVINQSYTSQGQGQGQEENDSVLQEQISDTVVEGTIDVKVDQQSSEEQ